MMATVTPFPRTDTTWTRTVHSVAARARATYPSLGGKIDHALDLVLKGAVEQLGEQPEYLVQSETDPTGLEPYSVLCGQPTTCTCKDYDLHRTERDYRCKHIVAVWIYRRALAAQEPAPAASAAPLPEAAFSITLKGTMSGNEALLTARGATWDEFRANVALLSGLLDAPAAGQPASPASAPPAQETPTCEWHGAMKASTKAPGTFYCTKKKADGSYCTSRWPQKGA
jgi:hypothetical protein